MEAALSFKYMIKVDICFANGSVIRCIGKVNDKGEAVLWTGESDIEKHIARINDKNPDLPQPLKIVRMVYEDDDDSNLA